MAVVSMVGLSQIQAAHFWGLGRLDIRVLKLIKARLDAGTEYEEPSYFGAHHAFNDAYP